MGAKSNIADRLGKPFVWDRFAHILFSERFQKIWRKK